MENPKMQFYKSIHLGRLNVLYPCTLVLGSELSSFIAPCFSFLDTYFDFIILSLTVSCIKQLFERHWK